MIRKLILRLPSLLLVIAMLATTLSVFTACNSGDPTESSTSESTAYESEIENQDTQPQPLDSQPQDSQVTNAETKQEAVTSADPESDTTPETSLEGTGEPTTPPEPTDYTVTFNENYTNGAFIKATAVGGVVTLPEEPVRSNYRFDGWFTDKNYTAEIREGDRVSSNVTLYGKWTFVGPDYTVTFMVGDTVIDTLTGYLGEVFSLPTYTPEEGSAFFGWRMGDTLISPTETTFAMPGENVTATAVVETGYRIDFDLSGGTGDIALTGLYRRGDTITLPDGTGLSRDGRTFLGWIDSYFDFYEGGASVTVTDSVTYYAAWTGSSNASFDTKGSESTYQSEAHDYGTTFALPSAPVRKGYIFKGWYDGKTTYEAGADYTMPGRDVTFEATWVKAVTVTYYYFDTDGQPVLYTEQVIEYGTTLSLPEDPVYTDHDFIGWYDSSSLQTSFDTSKRLTVDTSLYAKMSHRYFIYTLNATKDAYYLSSKSWKDIDYSLITENVLEFPSVYNGLPVVGMLDSSSQSAIYSLFYSEETPFDTVIIPAEWTEIPAHAFQSCRMLKTVIFEDVDNIESIGEYAFAWCYLLEKVSFGKELAFIGEWAFGYCYSLTQLDLSKTKLESISTYAFLRCLDVTDIIFPTTLKAIESFAFQNCLSVRNLIFPEGLLEIGAFAFSNVGGVNGEDHDLIYGTGEWNLISGADLHRFVDSPNTTDFHYVNCIKGREHIWTYQEQDGASYQTIQYFNVLESVKLPSTLTRLGKGAFSFCEKLKTVDFGLSALTELEGFVFSYTNIDDTFEIPSTVNTIGDATFKDCHRLTHVTIPKDVYALGYKAFGNCTSLTDVDFEQGTVINLKGKYNFYGCTALQTFTVPASVHDIGEYCFSNCTSLKEVIFEDQDNIEVLWSGAFQSTAITEVYLTEHVKVLMHSVFRDTDIVNATIPANITNERWVLYTTIGANGVPVEHVISEAASRREIMTNGEVTEVYFVDENGDRLEEYVVWLGIGNYVFAECKKLKTFVMPIDSKLAYMGSSMFQYCPELESVALAPSVKTVEYSGDYQYSDNIKNSYYNMFTFDDCPKLATFTIVGGKSDYIKIVNGNMILSADGTVLQRYAPGATDEIVTVPSGVIRIGYSAFQLTSMKHVRLPASVETIGIYAFRYCYDLETLVFDENSNLKSIGNYAFNACNVYPEITVDGMTYTDYQSQPIRTALVKLVFTGSVPPTLGTNVFLYADGNPNFTIYVHESSLTNYKSAPNWNKYSAYFKTIESDPTVLS